MSFHIIGDADTVLGYRFAGVSGDVVETAEDARAAFKAALSNHRKGVLLITEAVEDMLDEEVTAHRLSSKTPYLAVMQDIWGPLGKRRSLQELIYEAVGIRIVQDER
jgi:vacuolar-type H+-ATPase subunit F/Vma7